MRGSFLRTSRWKTNKFCKILPVLQLLGSCKSDVEFKGDGFDIWYSAPSTCRFISSPRVLTLTRIWVMVSLGWCHYLYHLSPPPLFLSLYLEHCSLPPPPLTAWHRLGAGGSWPRHHCDTAALQSPPRSAAAAIVRSGAGAKTRHRNTDLRTKAFRRW